MIQRVHDMTWPYIILYHVLEHRGYYTGRYEVYFLVGHHDKIQFISLIRRILFFLLYRQNSVLPFNRIKAGNYVIDILTSEDMENVPLRSRV